MNTMELNRKEQNVRNNSKIKKVGGNKKWRSSLKFNGIFYFENVSESNRSHDGTGEYIEAIVQYNKGSKYPVNIWQINGDTGEKLNVIASCGHPHLFGNEWPLPTNKAEVRIRINLSRFSAKALRTGRAIVDAEFTSNTNSMGRDFVLTEFLGKENGKVKSVNLGGGRIKHLERGDQGGERLRDLPSSHKDNYYVNNEGIEPKKKRKRITRKK